MTADDARSTPALRDPSRKGGLLGVARRPALLWSMTKADLGRAYEGTILGWAWGFIRPLMRLMVYVAIIGVLLGRSKATPNFPVYIFCGLVAVLFFTTGLSGATKSLVKNGSVVRRSTAPRELLPSAAVLSAAVQLREPFVIMVIAGIVTGLQDPERSGLSAGGFAAAVGGMLNLSVFLLGLGLLFSAWNTIVRDTQQLVGVITMLASWASPVIYPWTLVQNQLGDTWMMTVYLSNPVTVAAFGVRAGFWEATVPPDSLPPLPLTPALISVAISLLTLALGAWTFSRLGQRMVQRSKWT